MVRSVFTLLFLVSFSYAFAQNVLVSTLQGFDAAVEGANAGDTIFLTNGTWSDVVLNFYATGTSDNPIVLTAQTPGEVILSGSSRLKIYGEHLVVRDLDFQKGSTSGDAIVEFRKSSDELAQNCRLTNSRILNYNPATDAIDYKWVSMYGSNNRVDHCHFDGKNNEGALLVVWLTGQANHHRIDHNYFANIPSLGRNGGETIRVGTSTNSMTESRTIVEYNLFEACDGEIEIISNKSGFNIYRYNTFRNNDGTLTIRHGNDCEVYGNFFFGGKNKSSGGVRIIGERHKVYNNYFQDLSGTGYRAAISMMNGVPDAALNSYFQVKNAEVLNNTLVDCEEPFAIGEGSDSEKTLAPLDCVIANNIAIRTTGSKAITYTDTPVNMTYESNYITGNVGISDAGIVNEDPGLELTDGHWRANSSSAITDAEARAVSYLDLDIDGQARDENPDIGCDEVADSEITNFPLSQEDVGFDWSHSGTPPLLTVHKIDDKINITYSNGRLVIHGLETTDLPVRLIIHDLQGRRLIAENIAKTDFSLPLDFGGIHIISLENQQGVIRYNAKVLISEKR
ncbi:polysaccharide lyase 6 family protein [Reichenbachiella carrageenanivorans]|uniref:Polysaccharide lyase 6 family protein n=1 Tax=Reichenbachiella carrageenanivorans TaxID=2979869 RepID=A0ABY6CXI7_9BACT|nr:polysaccharide lyase 6 family protein [Reichenbachiella carrageenanivorans]UXX78578.1 polysaccharide lyase 6 family protein [Reichenbachiella carrageenanivorans]